MGTADLVLVDWILHEIDGLEFVTRLRHESVEDTRVVMLVAAEPGMRELHGALMAGADDYLMKPFTSLQIDEKLAQVGLPGDYDAFSVSLVIDAIACSRVAPQIKSLAMLWPPIISLKPSLLITTTIRGLSIPIWGISLGDRRYSPADSKPIRMLWMLAPSSK